MKMIFLILATVTMASTHAALPDFKVIPRIVAGTEVNPKTTDTSFVVSISGGCGGTIIDAKWILTAAHCKSLFKGKVTGGSISMRGGDRVTLNIAKSYVHPKYAGNSNDFALLELATPIDFTANPKLSKIAIADANLESSGGLEAGVIATVYGWGVTSENGRPANSYARTRCSNRFS